MADSPAAASSPLSEIVSRADELYDSNKMREGLEYLSQYEQLDEVEVTKTNFTTYIDSYQTKKTEFCLDKR